MVISRYNMTQEEEQWAEMEEEDGGEYVEYDDLQMYKVKATAYLKLIRNGAHAWSTEQIEEWCNKGIRDLESC